MSTAGSTFDGINGSNIIINATAQTKNYIATDTDDQYRTSSANMGFKTIGTNSTYTFKDGTGAANTSLIARNGLFTEAVTSQYQTITPIASQTIPGVTISGPILNSDATIPLLKVQKTAGGYAGFFENYSPGYPPLYVNNTYSTAAYLQYSQSPNMPTTQTVSHVFGKDTSSNANSFLLSYYYNTLEANRKFMIKAWGDTNAALEIYQSGRTGTSASTGSVVVNGDLGATNLRSSSLTLYGTTGSAKLLPANGTTPYTLTLPSSIGSINNYLQLASVTGTDGVLQWASGTTTTSGAAYIAVGSYQNTSFSLGNNTQATVTFPTLNYNVNTGITYGTGGQSSLFQNVSGGSLYIQVDVSLRFPNSTTGNRFVQIVTWNGSSTSYYSSSQSPACTGTDSTDVSTSAIVLVPNNQWFGVKAYQTSGGTQTLNPCLLYFSVIGGSGLQNITLSALSTNQASTLFTTTGQQSGLSPTISFDLAQAPTGSGKFVLATSPSISNPTTTGTLTSADISSTSLTTPKLIESILDVDIGNTTLYPLPQLNLTIANTSILLRGTRSGFAGFTVYFPVASTMTVGQIIKISNNSTQGIYIATNTGSGIETLQASNTVYYQLLSNTGIFSTTGNWSKDGLIDRDTLYSTDTSLILKNGINLQFEKVSGNVATISAPSNTTTWNFILPVDAGLPGQVLSTAGGSSAMTWADAFTNQSVINSPYGNHNFGVSSTSVGNSIIIIKGTQTNNLTGLMYMESGSTTSNTMTMELAPNLTNGSQVIKRFGQSNTNFNSVSLRFNLITKDSTTANYLGVNHYGQSASTFTYPPLIQAAYSTGTFQVAGGIYAQSAYFDNTTSVNDLTVRGTLTGNVTGNIINATTINTTNLTVNGTALGYASGYQTDLTLWWAYNLTDPTVTGLSYPPIPYQPSGTNNGYITNQSYYWQQVGKAYTFTLNFYCTIINTSTQLHLLFLRMNSHDPPTPIFGDYTMNVTNDAGSTESYGSNVQFGNGIQIPAT